MQIEHLKSHYSKFGMYNEVKYRVDNNQLRMQFYLNVVEHFCTNEDKYMLSVIVGSKVTMAAQIYHMPLDLIQLDSS